MALLSLASAALLTACGEGARAGQPVVASEHERTLTRFEELSALGYGACADGVPEQSGVVLHDPERACAGWNLVTSAHAPEVLLLDMQGRVLHAWSAAWEEIFPYLPRPRGAHTGFYRRAHLYPNGDVLVIFEGQGIARLDRDSKVLWGLPNGAHHDLDVHPDGNIYVLTRDVRSPPGEEPILEDFVTILGPDGRERGRVSLLEALENSNYLGFYRSQRERGFPRGLVQGASGDLLHTNSLELLDGRMQARLPLFRAGRILVSFRRLSALAVVDLERVEVVWLDHGDYRGQHDPGVVGADRLLVFDNLGADGRSRVVEYDAATMEALWAFQGGDGGDALFSQHCGTAQRLPNGNTLITETSRGRALEVTPDGTRVWEFRNPRQVANHNETVARLFEVLRLPSDFVSDLLASPH